MIRYLLISILFTLSSLNASNPNTNNRIDVNPNQGASHEILKSNPSPVLQESKLERQKKIDSIKEKTAEQKQNLDSKIKIAKTLFQNKKQNNRSLLNKSRIDLSSFNVKMKSSNRYFNRNIVNTQESRDDTIDVSWGDGSPGILEAAITGPGVYRLEAGKVYLTIHNIPIDEGAVHIVSASPSGDEHPATIQPHNGEDGLLNHDAGSWPNQVLFTLNGDDTELKLEGLILNGVEPQVNNSLFGIATARGARQKIIVEECILSSFKHLYFSTFGTQTDFHITNSVAKEWLNGPGGMFFGGIVWGGGSWMGTIDTIVVQNNTIEGVLGEAFVIYEHVDYGIVDHNTFTNINMNPIWRWGQNNLQVTNNLFYNCKSYGQSTYDISDWGVWYPGGVGQMSLMQRSGTGVTSGTYMMDDGQIVDMDNRNINYYNNAWHWSDNYREWVTMMASEPWSWEYGYEDDDGNWITETRWDTMLTVETTAKWLDDTTTATINEGVGVTESNNIEVDDLEMNLDMGYLDAQLERTTAFRSNPNNAGENTPDWWTYQPDGNHAEVEWPMHYDASYDNSSAAAAHCTHGEPVGSTRWMDHPSPISFPVGIEYEYTSVEDLYEDFGYVLASLGSECPDCEGNLDNMGANDYITIEDLDEFLAWAEQYNFGEYYFQFIDVDGNEMYDTGEIYAVSCESGSAGNYTVAYSGGVYWMDFIEFWMAAYDFEFYPDDGGGEGYEGGFQYLGEWNGHYYYVSMESATWFDGLYFTDTVEVGEGIDVYMGTVTSQEENDFLQTAIYDSMPDIESVWLGFTDEYEEGNWQWVTGEDVVYTNWEDGEPNNFDGNEHYAEMTVSGGAWYDMHYYYQIPFIVELEFNDEPVYFVKEDYADYTDPENWDEITGSVAITRANNQGLFNPYFQDEYNAIGPTGTLWAWMVTEDATQADYMEWHDVVSGNANNLPGQTLSLWCLEEGLFFDIQFESWTGGNNGGGFSYWRYPVDPPPAGPGLLFVWSEIGNDESGDGSFDYPFGTIGHALSVMNDGDFIIVGPGVYQENLNVENSSGILVAISGPDSTVIDGNGLETVFGITNGDWIVAGFTITNGYGDNQGGGVRIWGGSLMMNNNQFINNSALTYGGGLVAYNADVMIDSSLFLGNNSNNYGGGLHIVNDDPLQQYRFVSIENTVFAQNTVSDGQGAGAYLASYDDVYTDVYMNANGFVQNSGNNYSGLRINGNVNANIFGNAFVGNEAQTYAAAGGFSGNSSVYMDYSLIAHNHANLGGGNSNSGGFSVWSGAYGSFNFCTFVGNEAEYGSALTAGGGAYADVNYSIIWNNLGDNSLAAVQWDNNGSSLYVYESVIQGGENGGFADELSYIDYYNIIDSPPFFCDPQNGDFSIDEMSPAVTSWGEPMGAFGFGCSGTIQASASILNVEDIPDDQGGRVYITFEKSLFDTDGLDRTEMYTIERLDGDQWVGLNSIGAYGSNEYVVEATTLSDSTSENDALTTYRVIANMDEGNFESDPASGYSVDNIAPGMVTGVSAELSDGVVTLMWDPSDANDFSHYTIYHSNNPEFFPSDDTMLGTDSSPSFQHDVEEIGEYYYIVSAVDIHENEGEYSEVMNVTLLTLVDVHGLPNNYALHQNYPNPFNPSTTLRYDLPKNSDVSIMIFDMMGRQISTLLNGKMSAGYHAIQWDGTNYLGSRVAAGVYIYTIQAGQYRELRKMIFLK